jgi:hypothetical protein
VTDRHEYARRHGIVDQAVAITDKKWNDALARDAEQLVAAFLGVKWKEKRVDGGVDLDFRGWTIDVKWSPVPPFRSASKTRHFYASLRVPAWKPLRAMIYVAVNGSVVPFDSPDGVSVKSTDEDAMKIYGFAFRTEVRKAPRKDFGYTNYRGDPAIVHVVDLHELHSREMLKALPSFDPERRFEDALAEAAQKVPPSWAY